MLKMYIIPIHLHKTLSIMSIFFYATCLFYGGYYIIWNCTIYYSYSILLVTIDVWCKFYVKSQKSRQLSEGMHTAQTLCICLFTMFLRAIHNCKKKLQRNISGKRIYIIKADVCLFACQHSNVRTLTSPPVLKLWGTQGYLWLPYDLTEVIKLIGERFKPKNYFFFKKYFMSFLPNYCHSFRSTVIPSVVLSFLP